MIGRKCVLCRKQRHHHNKAGNCPVGKKHRLIGFTQFSSESTFQAREKSRGGASELRKDREVRRAVKSLPCLACGTRGTDWNPVDPAHIRTFKVTQSDHPSAMIPLCREHHRQQHASWSLFLETFPHVREHLEEMGWEITQDPFTPGRLIFTHSEVA